MKTLHLSIIVGIVAITVMIASYEITQNSHKTAQLGCTDPSLADLQYDPQALAKRQQVKSIVLTSPETKKIMDASIYCEFMSLSTLYSENGTYQVINIDLNNTKLLTASVSLQNNSVVSYNLENLVSAHANLHVSNQTTHYYVDSTVRPRTELYDSYYDGIGKDNATVSINNQTYYQTTLNYADYSLKKGTLVQFQNVTFAFPEGVMNTPGGAFIMLDVKFPDGFEEIYGENKKNPDGSGAMGGIGIPTQYGPHLATNSTTVLGNHVMPQAGITIYNDKIKLLVSTDMQISQSVESTSPLTLYLSTNSTSIQSGQAIGIDISLNNTGSQPLTLPGKDNWPINGLGSGGCSFLPMGIAVLDGYYTEQNMTDSKLLSFYFPPPCAPFNVSFKNYTFQPMSSNVVIECESPDSNMFSCPHVMEMKYDVAYSNVLENGDFHSFNPGLYTIVAGDEWGHSAITHFTVTNSTKS